jgi:two-component system, OmpR family, sensor kinase
VNRPGWIAWVLAASPLVAGFLLWAAMTGLGWLPDSVIYLRFNLGNFLLLTGLVLTGASFSLLGLASRSKRRLQREIQLARSEAETRRQQFLRRLDHELKNPLTVLQIEVANLKAAQNSSSAPIAQDGYEIAQRIESQVIRLKDLVIQLRKLAELETASIAHEPVDLGALVADLASEFSSTAQGKERRFDINISQVPWPLPSIRGDADLLYLAFSNVLDNALKYTCPGDTIQLRLFEDGRQVVVEIADTGPGIPDDEQLDVWEELYRGQAARGTPGSGLGLALVKLIIERHGGQTDLRSQIGRGTVVALRLPASL